MFFKSTFLLDMSVKVRIRRIGNTIGVILPESMLNSLNLYEGDLLFVEQNEDGLSLTPQDPELNTLFHDSQAFMDLRRRALHELVVRHPEGAI